MSFLAFCFLLQSIGVRNRFKIRINNVMAICLLATTAATILVLPIRHYSTKGRAYFEFHVQQGRSAYLKEERLFEGGCLFEEIHGICILF